MEDMKMKATNGTVRFYWDYERHCIAKMEVE